LGFVVWLIILFALQYGLSFFFQTVLQFNFYVSDTFINLVLAFAFTVMNFRMYGKEMFKIPEFHKSVAKYFIILMAFSLIFWFI